MTPTKQDRTATVFCVIALICFVVINGGAINRPPFDAHNFRQCQTLFTIEYFASHGVDLMRPVTNYTGEPGILVLELPLFQALAAFVYNLSGQSHAAIRCLNLCFSLASLGVFFQIAKSLTSRRVALLAVAFTAVSPLFLTYSGSYLIDPFIIFLELTTLLALYRSLYSEAQKPLVTWVWWTIYFLAAFLTVMQKALYLLPSVILGIYWFIDNLRNRKIATTKLMLALLLIFPAGVCFLWWQHHAAAENFRSLGYVIDPSSLLGFSKLLEFKWYVEIGKRILWRSSGLSGLLAAAGWFIFLCRVNHLRSNSLLWVLTLGSVIGYHLLFPNITFPHDYYTLCTMPFLALAAAESLADLGSWLTERSFPFRARWVPISSLFLIFVSISLFLGKGGFQEVEPMIEVQKETAGRFKHDSFAITFVSEALGPGGAAPHAAPAFLYALGLRGGGYIVADGSQAEEIYAVESKKYKNLRYLVFYGLTAPAEFSPAGAKKILFEPTSKLTAWELPIRNVELN